MSKKPHSKPNQKHRKKTMGYPDSKPNQKHRKKPKQSYKIVKTQNVGAHNGFMEKICLLLSSHFIFLLQLADSTPKLPIADSKTPNPHHAPICCPNEK